MKDWVKGCQPFAVGGWKLPRSPKVLFLLHIVVVSVSRVPRGTLKILKEVVSFVIPTFSLCP